MAAETSRGKLEDQLESAIDDLIRDILDESGASAEPSARGGARKAVLIETAIASLRGSAQTPLLERILIAEAFASELAEAIAPALAEQLAGRLLKALEQSARGTAGAGGKGRATASDEEDTAATTRSNTQARRTQEK